MLLPLLICLFYLPMNSLLSLHTGIEDMEMIYFCCSDIIRDMIWQGIYKQVLMTVLNKTANSTFVLIPFLGCSITLNAGNCCISFLSLQLGRLLCPSFMFWGFKALHLVPQSFLSELCILHNMMPFPSENLTLFLIILHLCWCNIHFPG